MIASLRGTLLQKEPTSVVVECGGVGYGVSMSLGTLGQLDQVGSDVTLLIYTQVGEDVLRLFGFLDALERRTFVTLLGLSGVGPRLALAILSTMVPDELAAVVHRQDAAALVRIPGVGKKTAERLLLELRGKFDDLGQGPGDATHPSRVHGDVVSALVDLGFSEVAAAKAADVALKTHPEADIDVLVRHALRASTQ